MPVKQDRAYYEKQSKEVTDNLAKSMYIRNETLENCKTIDELFTNGIKKLDDFSDLQRDDHEYYKEVMKEVNASIEVEMGRNIFKYNTYKDRLDSQGRKDVVADQYYIEKIQSHLKDERFINGLNVERSTIVDYAFVKRAGEIIRSEEENYKKTSAIGRFFSYLNPFSNKYRTMRQNIQKMKDDVVKNTGVDEKDFNHFVSGKDEKLLFEKGLLNTYNRLTSALVEREHIILDETVRDMEWKSELNEVTHERLQQRIREIDSRNAAKTIKSPEKEQGVKI